MEKKAEIPLSSPVVGSQCVGRDPPLGTKIELFPLKGRSPVLPVPMPLQPSWRHGHQRPACTLRFGRLPAWLGRSPYSKEKLQIVLDRATLHCFVCVQENLKGSPPTRTLGPTVLFHLNSKDVKKTIM